jgi:outer membrane protein assembly factor BamE (lipoprotein component of BamABCDE complex)
MTRKIIYAVTFVAMLSGCAAQHFNTARENANLVKSGMTVAQASQILGMPPTHASGDVVQWRRGNAQRYTGRATGAVEFHVSNGLIVDVPEAGIFSQAAVEKIDKDNAEQARLYDLEVAEGLRLRAIAAEESAKNERLAKERALEERAKEEAQRVKDVAAELDAADKAVVQCKDKIACSKVFALAQIYVQQNADQKIQVATDTIIETYNPTEDGKIGIAVIKIPRAGRVELVKIAPTCKDERGYFEKSCRSKRTQIYRAFKPFIERSLSM